LLKVLLLLKLSLLAKVNAVFPDAICSNEEEVAGAASHSVVTTASVHGMWMFVYCTVTLYTVS